MTDIDADSHRKLNKLMSSTFARSRQLLIGLDAMEWSLVTRWASEGRLPTFRRLMETGFRARLSSSAESLADTAWPALCCGVNPGKLGKYFYVQYDADTAGLRYMSDSEIAARPFWHYLDGAGLRVAVADVPHLQLEKMTHGMRLVNWGTHDNVHNPCAAPFSLLGEIEATFGKYPLEDCEKYNGSRAGLRKLRQAVFDGIHAHGRLFRWLMNKRSWDIFFGVFSSPHCVGHHFWRFMDRAWPDYRERNDLEDTIELAYRAIDSELAETLAFIGADTRVLVFAAHGMGPLYHASWNLNEILDLLGFNGDPPRANGQRVGRVNPWRILKMALPAGLQYRVKESLPKRLQEYLLFLWYAGGRSYAGRRVFAIPNNDNAGAIRLGVVGRDHKGTVDPGEEYRRVCGDIANRMRELTDPVSGRPVVDEVIHLHEKYHGPCVGDLPDLTVRWNHSFPWRAVHSPRFGTLRLRRQDARSGAHNPYGFVIAVGPGIEPGTEADDCSIYDIAPTILRSAGVAVPENMDGQARPELMPFGFTRFQASMKRDTRLSFLPFCR